MEQKPIVKADDHKACPNFITLHIPSGAENQALPNSWSTGPTVEKEPNTRILSLSLACFRASVKACTGLSKPETLTEAASTGATGTAPTLGRPSDDGSRTSIERKSSRQGT